MSHPIDLYDGPPVVGLGELTDHPWVDDGPSERTTRRRIPGGHRRRLGVSVEECPLLLAAPRSEGTLLRRSLCACLRLRIPNGGRQLRSKQPEQGALVVVERQNRTDLGGVDHRGLPCGATDAGGHSEDEVVVGPSDFAMRASSTMVTTLSAFGPCVQI